MAPSPADWRSPEQALEWDLQLVESVFRSVIRQYAAQHLARQERLADHHRHTHSMLAGATETSNQEDANDSVVTRPVLIGNIEHRLVAKADFLVGLKTAGHYLEKRPFLRSLYTSLACCSNEQEMASVSSYVKHRLRDRTISYAMVRAQLRDIYQRHVDLLAFEAKVVAFKEAAKAQSIWCVRDPKAICKRPSQFYGVHNIPKTKKQLERERQIVLTNATAVVNNAVALVISQLVNNVRPTSGARSSRGPSRPGSSRQDHGGVTKAASRRGVNAAMAARAKTKRELELIDSRKRDLRVQIFVPGYLSTRSSSTFGSIDRESLENSSSTTDLHRRQMELLALAEANGDARIAQQLLLHKIPHSGFRRVTEHLSNLGKETTNAWEVLKLWKTVYRNHTVHSIQQFQ
ncbi:hypothetical protein P43SY_009231 [Pythium insidiosum]|uniref:Uncharacterized protein n=1 Tax=Pythium insidiosum TaxID=114742 RepID=A0AAD5M4T8_PYTIN|nr:hypothetical protein P43SY_009231 [Pythium insidiosum]